MAADPIRTDHLEAQGVQKTASAVAAFPVPSLHPSDRNAGGNGVPVCISCGYDDAAVDPGRNYV